MPKIKLSPNSLLYLYCTVSDDKVYPRLELVHGVQHDLPLTKHKTNNKSIVPVKPYRTPPSSSIQSSATQKCCGVVFIIFFCTIIFYNTFILIEKFVIFCVKYFIPHYCIYRNVIPQNLNSLLRLVVAKWTFAVWFHAVSPVEVYSGRRHVHAFDSWK